MNNQSPLSLQGYFNCNSPDHMIRDRPRPINTARAAVRRLDYKKKRKTENSVHVVLAELCRQVEIDNREQYQQTD